MKKNIENNTSLAIRLKHFIEYKGVSINKFSESVGASNSYFNKVFSNNTSIGSDRIERILNVYPELSSDWLIMGKGAMINKNAQSFMSERDTIIGNAYGLIILIERGIKTMEIIAEEYNLKISKLHYNSVLKRNNRLPYDSEINYFDGKPLEYVKKEFDIISECLYTGVFFDLSNLSWVVSEEIKEKRNL